MRELAACVRSGSSQIPKPSGVLPPGSARIAAVSSNFRSISSLV